MQTTQLSDSVSLNDLIMAYLRFKEWMDYDTERSAYCAKEIAIMQALFGTSYIKVPFVLLGATHEELLNAMEERQAKLTALAGAVDASAEEDEIADLLRDVDRTTFRSTVHYFITLHEAIWQAAESVSFEDESNPEKYTIDNEPFEDHFEEVNEALFEDIRAFIISEHPEIKSITFPVEKVYTLGLPRHVPEPIDYGQTAVN